MSQDITRTIAMQGYVNPRSDGPLGRWYSQAYEAGDASGGYQAVTFLLTEFSRLRDTRYRPKFAWTIESVHTAIDTNTAKEVLFTRLHRGPIMV